jgi:hypothetical protein
MNDLSVLFPLPQTPADVAAQLAPSAQAVGGQLLPEVTFNTASVGVLYSQLRVVAFRLDPCFGQLGAITDPSTCHNQLRVVFQPVIAGGSGAATVAADQGVHAFYSLTRDQLVDAVNDMIAARESDHGTADLGPLAPNAIIASEGLAGTLGQAYAAIITKYAGGPNMVRMTSFQIDDIAEGGGTNFEGGSEFWQFESFDIANGMATPRPIATVPGSVNEMSLSAGIDPLNSGGSPMTTSNDNIAVLENMDSATMATPTVRQAAFDSALRIENPADNSPDTIDCVSCHLAEPARQLVGEPLGMTATGDSNGFVPDASIPLADLAQTTQLIGTDQVLNIHAFSYRNNNPMINQRVINETAANLAYIKTLLQ